MEFERGKGVGLYLLHNVYLYHYGSAEILCELSEDLENDLLTELLRYDPRTDDRHDPEKMDHLQKHEIGVGMYYCSCCLYYFMALEGFVNLIFHSFLKDEYRDEEFDWERRLDLDQKLRMMPDLCTGFKQVPVERKSVTFVDFKMLQKYRNQMFHSKIVDSLKTLCIYQDGFHFTERFGKERTEVFPSQKMYLKRKDVILFKEIVDKIIREILDIMDTDTRNLVNQYMMKETDLPFWRDEKGNVRMGRLKNGGIERSDMAE
jgi:hypothetical protein